MEPIRITIPFRLKLNFMMELLMSFKYMVFLMCKTDHILKVILLLRSYLEG